MLTSALIALTLAAPQRIELKIEGTVRSALVVAPSSKSDHPPLVLAFHGHGGNSRAAQRKFRIENHWKDALVVYPQGITGVKGVTDPEGRKTGWQKRSGDLEDRDLKFVDGLLKWASMNHGTDSKQTFATGHSNGSGFTWVLHAARNDKFAAFAGACGGGSLQALGQDPKPVLVIAGSKDQIVSLDSITRFAEALKKRNGCGLEALSKDDGIHRYGGQQPVWTWVYSGGHNPPDNVGEKVVEFFKSL